MRQTITYFIIFTSSCAAQAQDSSTIERHKGMRAGTELSMMADAVRLPQVKLFQSFTKYDDGDLYQCQGAVGAQFALLNDWLPLIRINTDNGWGGCLQTFGILDPSNALAHYTFAIDWQPEPSADSSQCLNSGRHVIPITANNTVLYMTPPIKIDTDDRRGGCAQTWSVAVDSPAIKPDYVIDILFYPDDQGVDQCRNTASDPGSPLTARVGSPVRIVIDTDSRYGGCRFSARLRKLTP